MFIQLTALGACNVLSFNQGKMASGERKEKYLLITWYFQRISKSIDNLVISFQFDSFINNSMIFFGPTITIAAHISIWFWEPGSHCENHEKLANTFIFLWWCPPWVTLSLEQYSVNCFLFYSRYTLCSGIHCPLQRGKSVPRGGALSDVTAVHCKPINLKLKMTAVNIDNNCLFMKGSKEAGAVLKTPL